jgi:VWFA-related protein
MQSTANDTATPVRMETSVSMEQMARASGGVYYQGTSDLLKDLRSALADGREYYVLAYAPKNNAPDGKFRTITVETTDKKLTIRAKPGYWAEGAAQ